MKKNLHYRLITSVLILVYWIIDEKILELFHKINLTGLFYDKKYGVYGMCVLS